MRRQLAVRTVDCNTAARLDAAHDFSQRHDERHRRRHSVDCGVYSSRSWSSPLVVILGVGQGRLKVGRRVRGQCGGAGNIPDDEHLYCQWRGNVWYANLADNSRRRLRQTLVITTFSATSASGTFSFVAPAIASTGATASKTVTNGTFNVTF